MSLEGTGNYCALLGCLLSEAGITISLKNPLKGYMELLPLFDAKCNRSIGQTTAFREKQVKHIEETLQVHGSCTLFIT